MASLFKDNPIKTTQQRFDSLWLSVAVLIFDVCLNNFYCFKQVFWSPQELVVVCGHRPKTKELLKLLLLLLLFSICSLEEI